MNRSNGSISFVLHLTTSSNESSRKITIAMTHSECSFSWSIKTVCRINIHTTVRSHLKISQIQIIQLGAEVKILSRLTILYIENERDTFTIHRNLFSHRRHGNGHKQECN